MHVMCTITYSRHAQRRARQSIRSVLTLVECDACGRSPVWVCGPPKKQNKRKNNNQRRRFQERKKEKTRWDLFLCRGYLRYVELFSGASGLVTGLQERGEKSEPRPTVSGASPWCDVAAAAAHSAAASWPGGRGGGGGDSDGEEGGGE